MRLIRSLHRKARQTGAIAILYVAALPVTALSIALSVDVARFQTSRTALQSVIDMATLAAVSPTLSDPQREDMAHRMIAANLPGAGMDPDRLDYTVNIHRDADAVTATIYAEYMTQPLMMDMFGGVGTKLVADSVARQDTPALEISLVLDISGSMRFNGRIYEMKDAAREFINIVYRNDLYGKTSVNIVPYAGTVNLGSGYSVYLDPATDFGSWTGCMDLPLDERGGGGLPHGAADAIPDFYHWGPDYWGGELLTWCPTSQSRVRPHQVDRDEILTIIDNLLLGDGTGTADGAAWGLKMLDPAWMGLLPGAGDIERPLPYGQSRKILVIMTDGRTTDQWRPGGVKAYNRNTALDSFQDTCTSARSNGIEVFTVGFDFSPTDWMAEELRECASTSGHAYIADLGQLQTIFAGIAEQITPVRLTQ